MAFANLALSVALARPLGLVGVALGTAIPVTLVAVFGIFPTACRRVDVSFAEMFREALWPALWPAAIAGAVLAASRARCSAHAARSGSAVCRSAASLFRVLPVVDRTSWPPRIPGAHRLSPEAPAERRLSPVGTANASP